MHEIHDLLWFENILKMSSLPCNKLLNLLAKTIHTLSTLPLSSV